MIKKTIMSLAAVAVLSTSVSAATKCSKITIFSGGSKGNYFNVVGPNAESLL